MMNAQKLQEIFDEYRQVYLVTNPYPERPKGITPPKKKSVFLDWRLWVFGPVALAAAFVSAFRTATAAASVASLDFEQLESTLFVMAVEALIVAGMLIRTHTKLLQFGLDGLKEKMAKMQSLSFAIGIAVSIALVANVTQVAQERLNGQLPDQLFFYGDIVMALFFSAGIVLLAIVSAEQLAFISALSDLEFRERFEQWKDSHKTIEDAYQAELDDWEQRLVRSFNSKKKKLLAPPEPVQQKATVIQEPDATWTKDQKVSYVGQLIGRLWDGNGTGVSYAEAQPFLGAISRSAFFGYLKELEANEIVERVDDGQGYRPVAGF